MRTAAAVSAALILGLARPAPARVYSPRVISPHNADAYSLKTFAEFPRWRGLSGDRLAWEVYRYLADARTGLFHVNEVLEGDDVLSEYTTVRDPIKIINVYGYAYCAILGPSMAGISEGIGLGTGRTIVIPAWSHVFSEAFYDDGWHYIDLDVRAVFRRPDGTLASLADARRDPSLWKGPRGPLFFPNDDLEATRRIYARTEVHHYHAFHTAGHTMDLVLRQGESFARWWTPQGGRWHHRPEWNRSDWLVRLLEQPPRGPKPNHRDFTIHDHANGRFVYAPDLSDRSTDFDDGVDDASNVRPGAAGLTLAAAGEGYAVFEVATPYIIVPLVGRLDTREDDREASILAIDAAGARLSISTDNGMAWTAIAAPEGRASIDLTRHVAGTYGYLLKIALRGEPGEAIVRSLSITTWVQVAPAALPALREGTNRMEFRTGDHHGLGTRAVRFRPRVGDPKDFERFLETPPADYDLARKTGRIRGSFVARFAAPPNARIAWFSAGGSFRTYLYEAAKGTRNRIEYAVDAPRDFREIYLSRVPLDTEHWHMNADREVVLASPAKTVYIRYTGDPAANAIRLDAHILDEMARPASPVRITHAWSEGGERKTRSVTLAGPGAYEIAAGADPKDEMIEMSVASGR
ncbi:MAG: hypothetical protein JXP34_03865 [Planctomycetes bacterium]|nr:hypothetical protein [Planctomycetota bacterium]